MLEISIAIYIIIATWVFLEFVDYGEEPAYNVLEALILLALSYIWPLVLMYAVVCEIRSALKGE